MKVKRYSLTIETKRGQLIEITDATHVSIGDTVHVEKDEFSLTLKFKEGATIKSMEEQS